MIQNVRDTFTLDQKRGARPAPRRYKRERLLFGQVVSQLGNQIGNGVRLLCRLTCRWNPEGGARDEGEPIRGGILDNETVDRVLQLLFDRLRSTVRRGGGGVEVDFD